LLVIAKGARAEDVKQACSTDYEEGQLRRQKGALLASRDALRSCTRSVCPQVIQKDCARWLEEVERAIPSVSISATAEGNDAIDVAVTIDGVLAKSRLDGKPIELDPGVHELVFALVGYPELREQVLLTEGEARRTITARFARPATTAHDAVPIALPAPALLVRPVPPLVYVLGAVSIASAVSFVTFGALVLSERAHLRDACSPFCTDPSNGCEIDKYYDPKNCGHCGYACVVPNATAACAVGVCAVGRCDMGYSDCNHDGRDGCEVHRTSCTDAGDAGGQPDGG
jgi:hypothetical protein